MRDDAVALSAFSEPMAEMISRFADTAEGEGPAYFVCSANPRLVEGKPSKNPRYLQQRPDRTNAKATAVAELPFGPISVALSTRASFVTVPAAPAGSHLRLLGIAVCPAP